MKVEMLVTQYKAHNDPIVIKPEPHRDLWEVGYLNAQGCYERLARGIPTLAEAQAVAREIALEIAGGKYGEA
ncbi:MAG: hypothetical protein N2545_01120 [Thermoflexales bacterium]|nr:hypothetical protein [Thermoflexales bacterium]